LKRVSDADLRLLRIFSTVAESKGFAPAQASLNLSASSISGYITALEQRLGVRLCSRGRAGFSLTDKGALIYREAQRLFGAMDEFVTNAGAVKGRATGTLRIGLVDCTVTDPNAPIARAIQRFNSRDNDVRIELSISAPTALQRSVLERRLHLAIASFPVDIAALPAEPLYEELNSFYCGSGHPLFTKPDVTMENIRTARIVARAYWRGADLSRLGVEREAAAVEIMEAQATLILSGAYLGFLPEHYAAAWMAEGRLRRLLPETLSYSAPFSIIYRRSTAELQVVRQFIDDVRASLPATRSPPMEARIATRPRSRRSRARPPDAEIATG
jgi:DNA-binding transcriptional LysR family regulator